MLSQLAHCAPVHIEKLYACLDKITEPQYKYDIDWVNAALNRTAALPPAPATDAVRGAVRLWVWGLGG